MWRIVYLLPFWLLLFLVRQVVILAGFIITPVALLFAAERDTYRVPKWESWRLVRLLWWAWPWDNLHDGAIRRAVSSRTQDISEIQRAGLEQRPDSRHQGLYLPFR